MSIDIDIRCLARAYEAETGGPPRYLYVTAKMARQLLQHIARHQPMLTSDPNLKPVDDWELRTFCGMTVRWYPRMPSSTWAICTGREL